MTVANTLRIVIFKPLLILTRYAWKNEQREKFTNVQIKFFDSIFQIFKYLFEIKIARFF